MTEIEKLEVSAIEGLAKMIPVRFHQGCFLYIGRGFRMVGIAKAGRSGCVSSVPVPLRHCVEKHVNSSARDDVLTFVPISGECGQPSATDSDGLTLRETEPSYPQESTGLYAWEPAGGYVAAGCQYGAEGLLSRLR